MTEILHGDSCLVAKHCEDWLRREYRNIGVIVFDSFRGEWCSRFFGEHDDPTRGLDGRKLRGFSSTDAYREWHNFWLRSITEGVLDAAGNRSLPNSPEFAEVLCSYGGKHFVLEPCQPALLPSAECRGDHFVDYLFNRLVSAVEQEDEAQTFEARMRRITEEFGLRPGDHWRERFTLPQASGETKRDVITFPYAYLNGQIRLYKKISTGRATDLEADTIQAHLHDALWCFGEAPKRLGADTIHGVALLNTAPISGVGSFRECVEQVLSDHGYRTVDVAEEAEVAAEFGSLGKAS